MVTQTFTQKIIIRAVALVLTLGSARGMVRPVYTSGTSKTPLAVTSALTPVQKRGIVHPAMLKGADSPNALGLSLVSGMQLHLSSYVRNIYLFGDQNSAFAKLTKELFFVHAHDRNLRQTASRGNPATSATFDIIADLQRAASGELAESEYNNTLLKWQKQHQDLTGAKLSKKRIETLFSTIKNALAESKNGSALPFAAPWVLSMFAAHKAQTAQDVEAYYALLGEKKNIETYSTAIANECDEAVKNSFFSMKRVKLFSAADSSEKFAVALMLKKNYLGKMASPPVDGALRCTYKGQAARPVCQESAIRDLINLFVYDASNDMYTVKKLSSSVKPHESIVTFYARNSSPLLQNTQGVAQEWMDMLSNLPGVLYLNGSFQNGTAYEIDATEDNVFVVLNHLLCGNSAKNWQELGAYLSDESRVVTFAPQKSDFYKTASALVLKVSIRTTSPSADECVAYMHIVKGGHAYLEVPHHRACAYNEYGLYAKPVYTWDVYCALLNRAFSPESNSFVMPGFLRNAFAPALDVQSKTRLMLALPFVRCFAMIDDASCKPLMKHDEIKMYKNLPFVYQQYYLLARSLDTALERQDAILDGMALLAHNSDDLAQQIVRLIEATNDSFDDCKSLLWAIHGRFPVPLTQHNGIINALIAVIEVMKKHASNDAERADVVAIVERLAKGALHNCASVK